MLFIIYLFLFHNIVTCSSVGSTIFYKKSSYSECWSEEDIAKLRSRRYFENIIPQPVSPDKVNAKFVDELLKYFNNALQTVEKGEDTKKNVLLKEVLADTIGAHLRSEILPNVRLAYYAGYIPYRKAKSLHDFYEEIKFILNTQGLGWKNCRSVPTLRNFTVEKIRIGTGKLTDACSRLITKRDEKSCIHIPLPKSDDKLRPAAIVLPLKVGGLVNLVSPSSDNVLLKYYITAARCILNNSPDSCRHSDFVSFNNDLWHWMKRDVAPRLIDEKLYSAYGGVLRVGAAVQNYGKGLSRRNLFEYQDSGVSMWHPWKALKESYVYINRDWTPYLYIVVILMIGIAIILVQILYSYIIGDYDCNCKGPSKQSLESKDISYANVDSNIPAMLPSHQTTVCYSENKRPKLPTSKTKSSTIVSIKHHEHDLHENIEKLSDNENKSDVSLTVSLSSVDVKGKVIDVGRAETIQSPPKLETSITQMKIEKALTKTKPQTPMYSTSTVTNSDVTYQRAQVTDSLSSSSTSARTISSTSSKSRCRRSRTSRDLAWSRRVISKHSMHRSTSGTEGTEFDVTSYTTPKSHR
ncbi:uncharacterized protein LOC116767300 [Danaus plexippus]|uniref:uncharacterized protein LOC116767300 n=1 Tax=Danaus plexippus TaxID=13037 RepID=UPI002AAF64A3|nr:uncharacterized protein LOC116767300 [Danaus plexippus]